METTRTSATQSSPRTTEDLTPTPTQAENDAAMLAATGGDAAPGPPETQEAANERKPEPERRGPSR